MKYRFTFILITILFIASCKSKGQTKMPQSIDTVKTIQNELSQTGTDKFDTTEIICDSIYTNKRYKIIVTNFSNETSYDEGVYNSIFRFYYFKNGKYQELYSDSIQRHFDEIKFEDFNNDKVKDVLIENISDVRSNLTYYLYLIDTAENRLKKIKGFEAIKNPNYLPQYNLIDNYVMSGKIWTSFYKIKGDTIKDFGIEIYHNQKDDGSYQRDYKKAINTIFAREKNYH
jgi:hypothetical protein